MIAPEAEEGMAEDRNLGEQPLAAVMREYALKPHDLVRSSPVQMTHKMVSRGMKGRRLTPHVQQKILDALNAATHRHFGMTDIFTY